MTWLLRALKLKSFARSQRALRSLSNIVLILSLALAPVANASISESQQGQVEAQTLGAAAPNIKVDLDYKTIDAEDTEGALAEALEPTAPGAHADLTIVSTDVDSVIEQAAGKRVAIIPFGKAISKAKDLASGINTRIRNYPKYAVQAFQKDKIGFGITMFGIGTETIRWVHVSNASTFSVTSNIVYSILWTAMFLDKDTWSKVTRPIQKTYRRLFKMSEVIPDMTSPSDMAIKFLSGASLSVALNGGRSVLVSIDQLAHHTFSPLSISMPVLMGVIMTSVGFSWSELTGSIKTELYPRAKRIVQLTMNTRSVLTSWFAASAMLMNPETFGLHPWIIVSVSGVTGLITYANARKIIPRLEEFGKKMEKRAPFLKPRIMSCEALF